jgi:hypothetical protein
MCNSKKKKMSWSTLQGPLGRGGNRCEEVLTMTSLFLASTLKLRFCKTKQQLGCFTFFKNREQGGKTGLVWGLVPVGGGKI